MNFITYLDFRFQERQMEIGRQGGWSIWKDGDSTACTNLLAMVRFVLGILYIPWVLICYGFVLVGFVRKPTPKLMEAVADKAAHDKKLSKKLGMVQRKDFN